MHKKRLDRDKWGFERFPYYQLHMDNELFNGLVSVIYLTEGETCYWNFEKAGRVAVAGAGMIWLQLIPDGKKRAITAKFLPNKRVGAWYIDVIEDIFFDTDQVAVFTDKYLDVIFTVKGDLKIDDQDELDAAYQTGELSKQQYDDAMQEGKDIVNDYCINPKETEIWCQRILQDVENSIKQGLKPLKRYNTIFLDIDGVLDVPDPAKEMQTFIPETLEYLKEIADQTNSSIVVISTWRLGALRFQQMYPEDQYVQGWVKNWNYLMDTFRKCNIRTRDNTAWNKKLKSRGEEIQDFLQRHPDVDSYIIIDDCYHDQYEKYPELQKRLVRIDGAKGMEKHHIEEAVKLMNEN